MTVGKEWRNEITSHKDEWAVFHIFKNSCLVKLWGIVTGKIDLTYFDEFQRAGWYTCPLFCSTFTFLNDIHVYVPVYWLNPLCSTRLEAVWGQRLMGKDGRDRTISVKNFICHSAPPRHRLCFSQSCLLSLNSWFTYHLVER